MLILSRKQGEQIQVGEDVVLTVLEVAGSRVRLGLDAPEDRSIMRTELIEGPEAQTEPTEWRHASRLGQHSSRGKEEA